MPSLWNHLDFSATSKNISVGTVAAYIKRSRGQVNAATISGFSSSQPVILRCIANRCKALAHLQICHGIIGSSLLESGPAFGCLKSLVVGAEIGLDAVSQVLAICGSLRKAEFLHVTGEHHAKWAGDLSQLQVLTIDANKVYNSPAEFLEIVSPDLGFRLAQADYTVYPNPKARQHQRSESSLLAFAPYRRRARRSRLFKTQPVKDLISSASRPW